MYAQSETRSRTGRRSATPYGTTAGTPTYTFPGYITGKVTAWYYDPFTAAEQSASSPQVKYTFSVVGASGYSNMMGVGYDMFMPDANNLKTHYIYRPNTGVTYNTNTGVARSAGWHKLEWIVDGDGMKLYVDGVRADKGEAAMKSLTSFNRLILQCNWNNNPLVLSYTADKFFIDDVYVVPLDAETVRETLSCKLTIKGTDYSLSESSLTFDKLYPKDVSTTVIPDATGLRLLKGETELTAGIEYDLSGRALTLKREYLSGLTLGEHQFTVRLGAVGLPLVVNIIEQGKQCALTKDFDNFSLEYPADISVGVTPDIDGFAGLFLNDAELVADRDYTVSGTTFTFEKEYLSTLEVGTYNFTFKFPGKELVFSLSVSGSMPQKYYFDAINGDDSNDGHTPETAWKSLAKLNATSYYPGDAVYLHADSVWNGQIKPKGSGVEGLPITLQKYGTDDPSRRPIINGNGTIAETVYQAFEAKKWGSGTIELISLAYWEISGLEITNEGESLDSGRCGIFILNEYEEATNASWLASKKSHIYVRDCYVHNVNAHTQTTGGPKSSGGIIAVGYIDDLRFENNTVSKVDMEGIRNAGSHPAARGGALSETAFQAAGSIYFNNNYVEKCSGDGIVLSQSSEGLCERNVVTDCGNSYYGTSNGRANYAALWMMGCNNMMVQYNEVVNNPYHTNADGTAFDFDAFCLNNVYQYNYSSKNSGGVLLWMYTARHNVFRYNLSVNDGTGQGAGNKDHLFLAANDSDISNAPYIHNNTFIVDEKLHCLFDWSSNGYIHFNNNIVACTNSNRVPFFNPGSPGGSGNITGGDITNNIFFPGDLYYINTPSRLRAAVQVKDNLFVNPMLVEPGVVPEGVISNAGTAQAGFDLSKLAAYKLQPGSPAIDAGVAVTYTGSVGARFPLERDMYGNPIAGAPDIGIHEFSGDTADGATGVPTGMSDPNGTNVKLYTGETVEINPQFASDGPLYYKGLVIAMSEPGIITYSDGKVTGVREGALTLTFSSRANPDIKLVYSIEVVPNSVSGVTLAPAKVTLEEGAGLQLLANVHPAGAANKDVTFSTSDGAVAAVSASGELTAVAAGSAVITVTTVDGGFTAQCAVAVIPQQSMLSMKFDDANIGNGINQFSFVPAFASDQGLSPVTYPTYKGTNHYSTNVAAEASFRFIGRQVELFGKKSSTMADYDVYIDGVLFTRVSGYSASTVWGASVFKSPILENGEHTLTIKNARLNSRVEMSVDGATVYNSYLPVEKAELISAAALAVGEKTTLAVGIAPEAATHRDVVWASGDEAVAVVDESGTVTAVAAGSAVITATVGDRGLLASCAVTVKLAETEWETVSVNDTDTSGDNSFKYEGSWTPCTDAAALGGTYRTALLNGWINGSVNSVSAELKFTGSRVELYGRTEANGGVYNLYLDGVYAGKFDAYSAEANSDALIYRSPILNDGAHTLTVRPTMEKNEAATGMSGVQFSTLLSGAVVYHAKTAPVEVSVSTQTIVETLAAYLNITVADAPDGIELKAYLSAGGELLHETPVTGGKGRMYIPAAPDAGDYELVVLGEGYRGVCDIDVVVYNTDIWTAAAFTTEDGKLGIRFNAEISSRTNFVNSVTVGGRKYSASVVGINSLTVSQISYDSLAAGEKIVVAGVKYPVLFPSYSFTFTVYK